MLPLVLLSGHSVAHTECLYADECAGQQCKKLPPERPSLLTHKAKTVCAWGECCGCAPSRVGTQAQVPMCNRAAIHLSSEGFPAAGCEPASPWWDAPWAAPADLQT